MDNKILNVNNDGISISLLIKYVPYAADLPILPSKSGPTMFRTRNKRRTGL